VANDTDQTQGVINTCPSCGGALKAFASVCELCGHELAQVGANKTISDLVRRFDEIEAEAGRSGLRGSALGKEVVSRKARVIRDFPIPNSRADLQSLIYFIHPKVQDSIKPDPNAEDWRAKFSEVLGLAKNAYKGDAKTRAQFEDIERSLNTTLAGNLHLRAKRSPVVAIAVLAVIVLAVGGVVGTQYDKWKLKRCEDRDLEAAAKEKSRLEGVVGVVDALHKENKFLEANSALSKVKWEHQAECRTGDSDQARAAWDNRRKEMGAVLQQNESRMSADRKAEADGKKAEIEKAEAAQRAEIAKAEAAKRAEAERQAATKLTREVKQETSARKAATSKEF
jgi:hypothetical protein